MSDAATISIIRDLFGIAIMALAAGAAIYGFLRYAGGPEWNYDGNVLARPYGCPDAVVGLILLGLFYFSSTYDPQHAVQGAAGAPSAVESTESGTLTGMLFLLVLALMLLAYMRIRGMEPGEMFGMRQLTTRQAVLYGVVAFVVSYVALLLVQSWVVHSLFHGKTPDNGPQEPVQLFLSSDSALFRVLLGMGAVVVAPISEEVIFRGFFYGVSKRFTDRWFAAVFTSLVFACVHRHVGSAVPLFTLAMCLSIAYEMTGCLLVPMIVHSLFNAINIGLLAAGVNS